MSLKILLSFILFLTLGYSSQCFAQTTAKKEKPSTTPAAIAKKYLDDKKFLDENYVHRELKKEKLLEYKSDKVKKETTLDYESMFFSGRMSRRWVPPGEMPSGGFERDENGFNFDGSILDQFNFISSEPDQVDNKPFHVIAFKATENQKRKIVIPIKALIFNVDFDLTNVINSILGEIEVWDSGQIKAFRVWLPEKAKVPFSFGSGELEVLNVKLTTQDVDGRTAFKRVEIEYKAHGTAALVFSKSEHKIITIDYSDYKKMTMLEKSDYLAKTRGFSKINKPKEK